MDQPTVRDFRRPEGDPTASWEPGDAWLAGGTFLFSTPLPELRRLVDLTALGWPAIVVHPDHLEIGATCRVVELHRFVPPSEWVAGPFLGEAVECFLAGFKVWNSATVGGNICTSLPAGPMTTMATALRGRLEIWGPGGARRESTLPDFILGDHRNALAAGELVRAIRIPVEGLMRRYSFERFSLTEHGRSSEFLVATTDGTDFELTVTAATTRPIVIHVDHLPSASELREAISAAIPDDLYFDDPNGSPEHRRHMTYHLGEVLRDRLASAPARGEVM